MELTELQGILDKTLGDKMPELVERLMKPFKEAQDNKLKEIFMTTATGQAEQKKEIALKTIGLFKAVLHNDPVTAKALSEGTGADGGFFVHTEFNDEIQRLIPLYGITRRECRIWPMKSNVLTLPAMAANGGLTGYWINELGSKTASKWTISQKSLTAKKACAFIVSADELLEDASVEIYTILAMLIAETLGGLEDSQLFKGTTPFTGILTAAGTNAVTLTGNTFASIGSADGLDKLLDMTTAVAEGARAGGKYYMHAQIFAYLQKLQATTYDASHYGVFLYGNPATGTPNSLWGYPVVLSDYCYGSADTALNKAFVCFGNLKNSVAFGDRKQLTIDRSTEATVVDEASATINLFQQDAQAIRAIERVALTVTVPHALSVLKTAAS